MLKIEVKDKLESKYSLSGVYTFLAISELNGGSIIVGYNKDGGIRSFQYEIEDTQDYYTVKII